MDSFRSMIQTIRGYSIRVMLLQTLNLALIVCSALMIWKGLVVVTHSESPVVVVLSGSMEPGFQRGDILFLNMGSSPIEAGEVVVFKVDGRDVPIVHRVIRTHRKPDKREEMLTKGDNNTVDDRGLYAPGQLWLERKHVVGRAVAYLPHVGMATILLNDYPTLKFVMIGIMAFFVLATKE